MEKAMKKIEKAIIDLLCEQPFFGTLLLEIKIEKADPSLLCPTMIVYPHGIIRFNEEFVLTLTNPQLKAVLCHEILHLALLHFVRQATRDRKVWNIATDLEINGYLAENNFSLPSAALIPPQDKRGLSAEDWYKKLLENPSMIQEKVMDVHIYDDEIEQAQNENQNQGKQNQSNQGQEQEQKQKQGQGQDSQGQGQDSQGNQGKQNQSNQGQEQENESQDGNQGQDGQGQDGQGQDKKKVKKEGDNKKSDENGKEKEGDRSGKGNKGKKKIKEEGDKSGKEKNGENKGKKKNEGRKDEENDIIKKWKDALARAVNLAKLQGKMPTGLNGVIEKILRPQLDWRQVLRQFITKIVGDVDWSRKDRRFKDIYLPQHREKVIELVIAIDTSGSIRKNEFEKFFGEVNGILQSNGKYKIHLVQCDADIQKVEVISYPNKLPADRIEIKGRGGTDFRPVFEYMRKNHLQIPLIYFTDAQGTFPSSPPTFPVLWVITEAKRKKDIPFGNVIILDLEKKED